MRSMLFLHSSRIRNLLNKTLKLFRFGRKTILMFNTLFAGVIGISKSIVTSYWIFIALETLEPLLGDNFSTVYTMG